MMADRSDSPKDLVRYWKCIQDGNDCVFEVDSSEEEEFTTIRFLNYWLTE